MQKGSKIVKWYFWTNTGPKLIDPPAAQKIACNFSQDNAWVLKLLDLFKKYIEIDLEVFTNKFLIESNSMKFVSKIL